jgi:hypothetical protein
LIGAERFAVVPARAAEVFRRLPLPVRDVLRLCDGTRTVEAIAATTEIPVLRIAPVLERLASLGVIANKRTSEPRRRSLTPQGVSWIQGQASASPAVSPEDEAPAPVEAQPVPVAAAPPQHVERPTTAPGPTHTFSDDEERFFASSFDHLVED